MKAKKVNDFLFETYKEEEKNIEKYLIEESERINQISSAEELKKNIFNMTMGHHFPFNPVDPIRASYRKKIEELLIENGKDKFLESMLEMVSGEWKKDDLPDGAIH